MIVEKWIAVFANDDALEMKRMDMIQTRHCGS
jgi:hypothetical protein